MAEPKDIKDVNLYGRVIIRGNIRAVTGLHVGAGKDGVNIGGMDNPVMRDLLSNEPYIPGSSLKGKLRSLLEKAERVSIRHPMGKGVYIHVCTSETAYSQCPVCPIFGVPSEMESSAPTRLVVRDVRLTADSRQKLLDADTDQPFTEAKYEASIDRVTAKANPRPLERVPAGSVFGPFEMIFSIYSERDKGLVVNLLKGMHLLEDDYLGGTGSRGSGQVKFEKLQVALKPVSAYDKPPAALPWTAAKDLGELLADWETLSKQIGAGIPIAARSEAQNG